MFDNDEEAEKFAKILAVALANALPQKSNCDYCASPDRRKEHRLDHEFVVWCRNGWNAFAAFNWEVLRSIAKYFAMASIAWVAYFFISHALIDNAPTVHDQIKTTIEGKK